MGMEGKRVRDTEQWLGMGCDVLFPTVPCFAITSGRQFEALYPEGMCPGWSVVVKGKTSSSTSM